MLSLLQEELKVAMRAKDRPTITGLRNLIGKLKTLRIDKGEDLTKQECVNILQSSVKQLKESIRQFEKGGRDDLAEVEKFELELIKKYLPEQLSDNHVRDLVRKTIEITGIESIKNMGLIMGPVMKKLAGAVDGKMVQKIVREELNS